MFSAHALREKRGIPVRRAHTNLTTFTEYRVPACIVWLYYASSSTVVVLDNLFLLSVQVALKIKQ